MSRYIEEEAIIKDIDESGQRYGITTANQCNFKEIVRKTPTADVVPKSEVDEIVRQWKEEANCWQNNYITELRDNEQIKSDVAREIFEEIEKAICGIIAKNVIECTFEIDRIKYMEIKEKYTEVKNDN